jgi:hypothetical protein
MKADFGPYLDYYDVVEIYHVSAVQVYSNGRFLELTSIPLETIRKTPFPNLFVRSEKVKMQVGADFMSLVQNLDGSILEMKSPVHTLTESCGDRRVINCKLKYGTSLFDENDQVTHIIVTIEGEPCEKPVFQVLN